MDSRNADDFVDPLNDISGINMNESNIYNLDPDVPDSKDPNDSALDNSRSANNISLTQTEEFPPKFEAKQSVLSQLPQSTDNSSRQDSAKDSETTTATTMKDSKKSSIINEAD